MAGPFWRKPRDLIAELTRCFRETPALLRGCFQNTKIGDQAFPGGVGTGACPAHFANYGCFENTLFNLSSLSQCAGGRFCGPRNGSGHEGASLARIGTTNTPLPNALFSMAKHPVFSTIRHWNTNPPCEGIAPGHKAAIVTPCGSWPRVASGEHLLSANHLNWFVSAPRHEWREDDRLEYQWVALRVAGAPLGFAEDRFIIVIEGGDNNLYSALHGLSGRVLQRSG